MKQSRKARIAEKYVFREATTVGSVLATAIVEAGDERARGWALQYRSKEREGARWQCKARHGESRGHKKQYCLAMLKVKFLEAGEAKKAWPPTVNWSAG